MRDYVYPSIYFGYFYFFLLLIGAIYFCVRTIKQGYWGRESEVPKYRMLEDEDVGITEPPDKLRR
jgi:hypothetical protein